MEKREYKKEFVVEFLFKDKMLKKSIPIFLSVVSRRLKAQNVKKKDISYPHRMLKKSLISLIHKKTFDYYDAFVFVLGFSADFVMVKSMIKTGAMDINKNVRREDYWKNEKIEFHDAIYFIYTHMYESYERDISIDMKLLTKEQENKTEKQKKEIIKQFLDSIK